MLSKVKQGEEISASQWNEMIDALSKIIRVTGISSSIFLATEDITESGHETIQVQTHAALSAYNIYTVNVSPTKAFDKNKCKIKTKLYATGDEFLVTKSSNIASGVQSLMNYIVTGRPYIFKYTGTAPAAGDEAGLENGGSTLVAGKIGFKVLTNPDTTNHLVWAAKLSSSGEGLVELCAQAIAERNVPYTALLGTWNANLDIWCYDGATTVYAIDHRSGPPTAEVGWKGLYQRMPSTVEAHNGYIYVLVSLDCTLPPEGCNSCTTTTTSGV